MRRVPRDGAGGGMTDPTWFAASDTATVRVVAAVNDRHDQEAADAATHARLRLDPRDLRTVGERVDDELAVLREAIERIADSVTVLMLTAPLDVALKVDALRREIDELKRGQAVTIAGLEAYIRDHSESDDVPFAMAEDAWGVG